MAFIKEAIVKPWPPIQTCSLLREFPQIWPLAGQEKPAWSWELADTETSASFCWVSLSGLPHQSIILLAVDTSGRGLSAAPVLESQEAQLQGEYRWTNQLQIRLSTVTGQTWARQLPCPSDKGEGAGVLLEVQIAS